jgi:hypothetical protein
MMVCTTCLVGAVIPVIRPTTGNWEFATVERAFLQGQDQSFIGPTPPNMNRGNNNTHYARFMDSKCEWVTVEKSAYDHYITFHQGNNPWSLMFLDGTEPSFGEEDDLSMEDPTDDYDHESISRQLEKSFDAMDMDYGFDQRPGTALHQIFPTEPSTALTKYKINANEKTMTLSPSVSPGTMKRTRSVDESPFATPPKMSRNKEGGSTSTTSPKYSQKLWTPEVSTRSTRFLLCKLPSSPTL